jgi:hypothetical protein
MTADARTSQSPIASTITARISLSSRQADRDTKVADVTARLAAA